METTTLIALSKQGVLRRQLDIVANNIANMNTNGFKGERMMFVEHLVKSRESGRLLGTKLSFVRDIATMWNEEPKRVHWAFDRAKREFKDALCEVLLRRGYAGESIDAECKQVLALLTE